MVEEKEARRLAEDRAIKLLLDGEHRNEEVVESKVREAQRKARSEVEDENNERLKAAERRWFAENEDAKNETIAVRKKLDEALRQVEELKRKAGLSKEDGRAEAHLELDQSRAHIRELGGPPSRSPVICPLHDSHPLSSTQTPLISSLLFYYSYLIFRYIYPTHIFIILYVPLPSLLFLFSTITSNNPLSYLLLHVPPSRTPLSSLLLLHTPSLTSSCITSNKPLSFLLLLHTPSHPSFFYYM